MAPIPPTFGPPRQSRDGPLYRQRSALELFHDSLSVEQLVELAATQGLDLHLGGILRDRAGRGIVESGRGGRRRGTEPEALLAEVHLRLGLHQTVFRPPLRHAARRASREPTRQERRYPERSTRRHGIRAVDAGVSAAARGEGAPTWMWAPVAAPVIAPRNAMNETPALRRNARSAAPSGLSGWTATSRA